MLQPACAAHHAPEPSPTLGVPSPEPCVRALVPDRALAHEVAGDSQPDTMEQQDIAKGYLANQRG